MQFSMESGMQYGLPWKITILRLIIGLYLLSHTFWLVVSRRYPTPQLVQVPVLSHAAQLLGHAENLIHKRMNMKFNKQQEYTRTSGGINGRM